MRGPFLLDRDVNPVSGLAIGPEAGGKAFPEAARPGEEVNNGDRFSHHDPKIGPVRADRNRCRSEVAPGSGMKQP